MTPNDVIIQKSNNGFYVISSASEYLVFENFESLAKHLLLHFEDKYESGEDKTYGRVIVEKEKRRNEGA